MLDPFPVPPIPPLAAAITPLSRRLDFYSLPLHIHEVLLAAAFYESVRVYASPFLSRLLFPRTYAGFNTRTRLNWDVHVVSLLQSTLINALALWVSVVDAERGAMDGAERVYGYTGACGMIQAFACGYFVWDLCISVRHVAIFGPGMLAHAVSALAVFSLGFRPFVNYYAPVFILYELSSPFLNIHWFCDKLGLTGSRLQLYNGILLIGTFFACRLVWGTYSSVRVFSDIFGSLHTTSTSLSAARNLTTSPFPPPHSSASLSSAAAGAAPPVYARPWTRDTDAAAQVHRFAELNGAVGGDTPLWLGGSYLIANTVLHLLNFYWFGKMVQTVRRRFEPPLGTKGVDKAGGARRRKGSAAKPRVADAGVQVGKAGGGEARGDEEPEEAAAAEREKVLVEGIDIDTDADVGVESPFAEKDRLDWEGEEDGGIDGVVMARGVDFDGRRSVEVQGREVRRRG